jgi:hypothetical protein
MFLNNLMIVMIGFISILSILVAFGYIAEKFDWK